MFKVLSIMFLVLFSCKPSSKENMGEVKSIDHFVEDTLRGNDETCSGSFDVSAHNTNQNSSLLAALRAVPTKLQDDFFQVSDMKGQIILMPSVAQICTESLRAVPAYGAVATEQVSGCVKLEETGPVIYLRSDNKTVQQELVRAFGYAYAHFMINRRPLNNKVELALHPFTTSLKESLAVALLQNVWTKGSTRSYRGLEKRLPASVFAAGKTSDEKLAAYRALSDGERYEFGNYVLAETFDSWFCSASSRESLRKGYTELAELFAPLAKEIAGEASKSAKNMFLSEASGVGEAQYCGFSCEYGSAMNKLREQGVDTSAPWVEAFASAKKILKNAAPQNSSSFQLQGELDMILPILMQMLGGFMGGGVPSIPGALPSGVLPSGTLPAPFPTTPLPGTVPSLYPTPAIYPTLPQGLPPVAPTVPTYPTTPYTPTVPYYTPVPGNIGGVPGMPAPVPGGVADVQAIIDATNQERAKAGITTPLQMDTNLNTGCAWIANWNATNGQLKHSQEVQGYPYTLASENVAMGQQSVPEVMNSWMTSPGHRQNILNPTYTRMGAARVNDSWCQQFQ